MSKKLIYLAVLAVVFLGVGFEAGRLSVSHAYGGRHSVAVRHGKKNHGAAGQRLAGTVVSNSAGNLTIKLSNGSTETVYTSSGTTYSQVSPATSSSVNQGASVTVLGTKNSDGSLNAKKVQING